MCTQHTCDLVLPLVMAHTPVGFPHLTTQSTSLLVHVKMQFLDGKTGALAAGCHPVTALAVPVPLSGAFRTTSQCP